MGQTADYSYLDACMGKIFNAFEELAQLNNKRITPTISWSLCLGFARTDNAYDYPMWLSCMRIVNDICPVSGNGEYINYKQCYASMKSGYWIKNPKTNIPIE